MKKIPIEISTMIFLANPLKSDVEKLNWLNQLPKDFDWDYFTERVWKTSMAGFIMTNNDDVLKKIPNEKREFLKKVQARIISHNLILLDELKLICSELNSKHTNYAILKGWDLIIRGYYNIKERQISDIDILILPEEIEQLTVYLIKKGYKISVSPSKSYIHKKYIESHAPFQARKGNVNIDIHFDFFTMNTPFYYDPKIALHKKEEFWFENTKVYLIDLSSSALFCVLHTYKHLKSGFYKIASIQDFYVYPIHQLGSSSRFWNGNKELKITLNIFVDWKNLCLCVTSKQSKTFLQLLLGNYRNNHWVKKQKFSILFTSLYQDVILTALKIRQPLLILFHIFPSKEFMTYNFGKGNYAQLFFRRIANRFNQK